MTIAWRMAKMQMKTSLLVWVAMLLLNACGFPQSGGTTNESTTETDSDSAVLPTPPAPPPPAVEGSACGDCDVGTILAGVCTYPKMDVDLAVGLPPVDTGDRPVVDPDSFLGSDSVRLLQAMQVAAGNGGAVVMRRVFETDQLIWAFPGTLVTGGGIRRACSPVVHVTTVNDGTAACLDVDSSAGIEPGELLAVTMGPSANDTLGLVTVARTQPDRICAYDPVGFEVPAGASIVRNHTLLAVPNYDGGVIVDSVLFDGASRCNDFSHDWRVNNALVMRGSNVVRNSVFYDSPSEGITVCGGRVEKNRGFSLQGSFIHKSCGMAPEPMDIVADNYVDGSNLAGNAVMVHSAGLVTLSNNAGTINLYGNVFRNGAEGVFGYASPASEEIHGFHECYAHFQRGITLYDGARPERISFDAEIIDVPTFYAPFVRWP